MLRIDVTKNICRDFFEDVAVFYWSVSRGQENLSQLGRLPHPVQKIAMHPFRYECIFPTFFLSFGHAI